MNQNDQRLKLLSVVLQKINQGERFDDIVEYLSRALKKLIPFDRLAIGFMHGDGRTLVVGPVHSRNETQINTGYKESIEGTSLIKLIEQGKSQIISDLPECLRQNPQSGATRLLVQEGLKSNLTLPLIAGSKRAGVIWFASRRRGAYAAADAAFGELIAGHLALLLERGRMLGRVAADRTIVSRLNDENVHLKEAIACSATFPELIGESMAWRKMLRKVEMVATTESTVLIRGETGTGKELIARALHRLSPRHARPFIALNCGALSPELIASELFGHERGAFTGATQRKLGRLELAQHGTLFLDEVGELPPDMQVKLLRVLQEREFERVGGTQTLKTDVRVVAATNRNLEHERREGRFRDDLFFRLNVFPVFVPPLRERKEDIEDLLEHFVKRFAQRSRKTFVRVDAQTIEDCQNYHWPGNVRELENLIERSVILCAGPIFQFDAPLESEPRALEPSRIQTLSEVISKHLSDVLKKTHGKIYGADGAAAYLGLKPSTLQAKLRKYNISRRQRD